MMQKMQALLASLELKVSDTILKQDEYSYSMTLCLLDYNWTVFGEGRTEEACRADACLSLITAIQHQQFPDHFYNSLRGREEYEDILYVYPDAVVRDIRKPIAQSLLYDMNTSLSHFENGYLDNKTVLNRWIEWNGSPKLAFVPFRSLRGNKTVMLPNRIIGKMCYPYNVASGRTYEEALAHALVKVIKKSVGDTLRGNQDSEDAASNEWRKRCPQLYMLLNDLEPSPAGEISKEKLSQLIDMCYTMSREVYVRDNSFLGIPSVCVYIPGITLVLKENLLQKERKPIANPDEALQNLSKRYADFCYRYNEHLMDIYENDDFLLHHIGGVTLNELTAAYHIYMGDNASSLNALYQAPHPCKRIQAIICELEMKKEGTSVCSRNWLLSMLFGKEFCTFIQKCWRNSDAFAHIFNNLVDEPLEERLKGVSFPYRVLSLLNRVKIIKREQAGCRKQRID